MPTYKRNEFDNDVYVNKKNQCPSYTDRILYKCNAKCQVDVHEYTSIDNQFGSDHRPVALSLTMHLKPFNYLDPSVFLNTLIPDQGCGELLVSSMVIKIEKARLARTNRQFTYPLFLQPRFISEWLIAKPSGFEKRYRDEYQISNVTKTWQGNQLPKLYTAINSKDILSAKHLTVSFAMTEGNSYTPDNIAYAVIDMSELKPMHGSEFGQQFNADREKTMQQSRFRAYQIKDQDWEYYLV